MFTTLVFVTQGHGFRLTQSKNRAEKPLQTAQITRARFTRAQLCCSENAISLVTKQLPTKPILEEKRRLVLSASDYLLSKGVTPIHLCQGPAHSESAASFREQLFTVMF